MVLLTRPIEQSMPLKKMLEDNGLRVCSMPLILIKAKKTNKQHQSADIVIYISVNAVKHGFYPNKDWPALGIGTSTTKALERINADIIELPKAPYTSESLLDLDSLKCVKNKRIRIVKGAGGRRLLSETLRKRGAIVENDVVYSRELIAADSNKIGTFLKNNIQNRLVVASSVQLLEAMETSIEIGQLCALKEQTTLICISPRVEQVAASMSWSNILVSRQASNKGLFDTAISASNSVQNK